MYMEAYAPAPIGPVWLEPYHFFVATHLSHITLWYIIIINHLSHKTYKHVPAPMHGRGSESSLSEYSCRAVLFSSFILSTSLIAKLIEHFIELDVVVHLHIG